MSGRLRLDPENWEPGLLALCLAVGLLAPLNGLGFLILADPGGAFERSDLMTATGYGLTGLLAIGSVLVCQIGLRSLARGRAYGALLGLVATLPFLSSASSDLVTASAAVAADLWIAHRCLTAPLGQQAVPALRVSWINGLVLLLIVMLVGHELTAHPWGHVCLGLLGLLALAEARYALPPSARWLQGHPLALRGLLALPVLIFLAPRLGFSLVALLQLVLIVDLSRRVHLVAHLLEALYARPAQMFTASFSLIILTGTLFLTLPAASGKATPVSLIDALFTATSATCVTGLVVLDTPKDFSGFGHVVILLLIQVGGLGMITISSFVSLALGGRIGLRAEVALGKIYESDRAGVLFQLIRFIVLVTLGIEIIGALMLVPIFFTEGNGLGRSLWLGIFHSVSAFCNAGFALYSDSLVGLNRSSWTLFVVGMLIVSGGIGFGVLSILYRRLRTPQEVPRFPTHVWLSLSGTAFLLVAGTVLVLLCEWSHSLAPLPLWDRLTNAAFQSVTTRTAGFNSVDYAQLGAATVFVMILLMFIGACSNSTGGGIKVTTAMIMFYAVLSAIRGRDEVEAMGRAIPKATVYKTIVITALSLLFVSAGIFFLLATQEGPFDWIVFEVFSAFGTVGLSLGMTAKLDDLGKLAIIVLMFVGRIGPLTLALLLESKRQPRYRLPEASILVG